MNRSLGTVARPNIDPPPTPDPIRALKKEIAEKMRGFLQGMLGLANTLGWSWLAMNLPSCQADPRDWDQTTLEKQIDVLGQFLDRALEATA
jgi:hypothetical protein